MSQAVFNFLTKRKWHLSASLSQFDPKARDHSACQPLRVALGRVAGEFEDTVGDRFTHALGILPPCSTANTAAPIAMTQPVLGISVSRPDKSVSNSCDSRNGLF